MNRTLRRPMFRMGGAAEGLTSGLSRQGYERGRVVNPGGYQGDIPPGVRGRLYPSARDEGPATTGAGTKPSMMETLQTQQNILNALAPRQPRKDRSMSNFLIDFGLDLASRPPSGGIFATAAAAAKNPFARFQQAKQMETAYGMSETSEDRALLADLIKGMDEDKLSALMKNVKAGVDAGLWTEKEGIIKLLQAKVHGVLDEPGEQREAWIKWYMTNLMKPQGEDVDPGIARAVAEHQYKIDFKEYPEKVLEDVNKTKLYIKEIHVVDKVRDADGEVVEILVNASYDTWYFEGQIYLDPQSGDLFKRVSKKGEAPVFRKIVLEE